MQGTEESSISKAQSQKAGTSALVQRIILNIFKWKAVAQLEGLPILNSAFNAKDYFRNEKLNSIMLKKNYKNWMEAGEKLSLLDSEQKEM